MIEGITVIDIIENTSTLSTAEIILAIIAFGTGIVAFIQALNDPFETYLGVSISIILVAIGVRLLVNTNDATQYACLISDDVKMTEFYNHYDIIDRQGNIWFIEEKEIFNENT